MRSYSHFKVEMIAWYLFFGTAAFVAAAPTSSTSAATSTPTKYTLPQNDDDTGLRKLEIEQIRSGVIYGPSLIGETSFFPSGALGSQLSLRDQSQWANDSIFVQQAAAKEAAAVLQTIKDVRAHLSIN